MPPCFRPTEVETLLGNLSKARTRLGWQASFGFPQLVSGMMREDLGQTQRDGMLRAEGFEVREPHE